MEVTVLLRRLASHITEETEFRLKPMVTAGGSPVWRHFMKVWHARAMKFFSPKSL